MHEKSNNIFKFLKNALKIVSVSENDEGSYECFASNDAGTIRSKAAVVKINFKNRENVADNGKGRCFIVFLAL